MILVTHAITGAAVGQLVGNPVAALVYGFVSHFLLDAIPHWDYPLSEGEVKSGRVPRRDLIKIAADGLLGLASVFIANALFPSLLWWPMVLGAIGAMLPDALQFAYFKTKWRWLYYLQTFHEWIHTSVRLVGNRNRVILGVVSQVLIVLGSYWFISALS
jgi:hypothetical protein